MRTRINGEERAHRNLRREVTLREVYQQMVFSLHLEHALETLIAAELEAERESIIPIVPMRVTVDAVRQEFGRVLYISDMYLPEDFLAERLRTFGFLREGDRLYVSSTHGSRKASGELYREVLAREGLRPRELLHCGNCHPVDVVAAAKVGLRTHHFALANPNRSEELLNLHALRSEGLTTRLAGASRRLRLAGADLPPDEGVVWETAVSVTGPLVLMYAHWLIERAREKEVRHLLFLARDAFLPYLAVKALLSLHPVAELQAHYIFGSRATYLPIGITKNLGAREWDMLCPSGASDSLSVEEVRRALMARVSTFAAHVVPVGFPRETWERPLSPAEMSRLRQHAIEDPAFNRALLRDLRAFRRRTRSLLRGRGLLGGGAVAIVDTGWTTKSHAPLYHLLREETGGPVRIFYLGLDVEQPEVPLEMVDTFLYNCATSCGPLAPRISCARAMETLMMAPHGRTRGFTRGRGGVEPVLVRDANGDFVERFFALYEQGVLAFVRMSAPHIRSALALHDLRDVSDQLVRRFWSQPTRAEVRVWGGLKWELDLHGKVTHRLARPYGFRDAGRAFLECGPPLCHPQFWTEAALLLTPRAPRMAIEAAVAVRCLLSRSLRLMPARLAGACRRLGRRLMEGAARGGLQPAIVAAPSGVGPERAVLHSSGAAGASTRPLPEEE